MSWDELLRPHRWGCPKSNQEHNKARSEFQRDFDRVIFNSDFRRLNGKTQVFPFPQIDGIHTRLTHSMECASVGRSLGTLIGAKLEKEKKLGDHEAWEVGALISAACLAHDIGNPPFGHSGEAAIREFFSSATGREILSSLEESEKQDFLQFGGNAMGFHLLTHTNTKISSVPGGIGLTYPALAAFSKYPCTASDRNKLFGHSESKAGVLTCDVQTFKSIADELDLVRKDGRDAWYRHPFAFITEAADDICYNIIDLEDGHKLGLVEYEEAADFLRKIVEDGPEPERMQNVNRILDPSNKLGYLRSLAIHSLIHQVFDVFSENEEEIRRFRFEAPLTKLVRSKNVLNEIEDFSIQKMYRHRPVLQIEAAGFQVLPGLLELFLLALKDCSVKGKRCLEKNRKIVQILNEHYVFDYSNDPYKAVLAITMYVAGMTDSFALETYRNLKGIELPRGI